MGLLMAVYQVTRLGTRLGFLSVILWCMQLLEASSCCPAVAAQAITPTHQLGCCADMEMCAPCQDPTLRLRGLR